jgi:hypothetical protein
MSTASRTSPTEPVNDSKAIEHRLRANPFVKEVSSLEEYHYSLVLALNQQATDILIDYLSKSGILRVIRDSGSLQTALTVFVYGHQVKAERIQKELDKAFRKVSQFLEYLELRKDYAFGQVPRHLCQWLLEEEE